MFDATKYFQGSKRGCLKHPAGNASEMSLILFTSSSSCNISFWYDLIDKFCSFFTRSKSAKRSVKLARLTSASAAVKRFSANEWRYFFFFHIKCAFVTINCIIPLPSSSKVSRLMSRKLRNSSMMACTSFKAFSTCAEDSSESDFACPT